jgi:hypothetical protein
MDAHLSGDEVSGRLPLLSHTAADYDPEVGREHGIMNDPFVEVPEFKDARKERPLLKLMDLRARRHRGDQPGDHA